MALLEQTFPPYVAFGSRTLFGGETGTDIAVLQLVFNEMLQVMNPPQGPIGASVPATGVYDAATVQAVKNIQAYFGIAVDGVAGPNTYFLFGQGVGGHVTYGGPAYGSRSLGSGVTGGDVTVLQNRINLFRYSLQTGAAADGVFGPKTAAAVAQLQTDANANGDFGVPLTGSVGTETLDATWIYSYAGGRGMFTGRNGFDVVFAQLLLQKLGLYDGRIHGYYDAATRAAVIAFQLANGLTGDGVVGQATYYALGRHNLVNAPLPLPIPVIPAPPPGQVNCCFTLGPTSASSDTTRGGVFFIHNGPQTGPDSFAAQWIGAALLPDPSAYGVQFTQYGIGINGSADTPMTNCVAARSDLWTFALLCASCGPLTSANVVIAPMTAAGIPGPVVLQGTGTCPFPGPGVEAPDVERAAPWAEAVTILMHAPARVGDIGETSPKPVPAAEIGAAMPEPCGGGTWGDPND